MCAECDTKASEKFMKDSLGFWSGLAGVLIGIWAWDGLNAAWHSKFRYSSEYPVRYENVHIANKPHDCSFVSVPMGEKYCHYDRVVTLVDEHAVILKTSTTGQPVWSSDGINWYGNEDGRVKATPAFKQLYVTWTKVDD